jgi:hypothetical protein
MAILLKAIYMFNITPTKIPMEVIKEIEKINPKVHLAAQKTMNSQGNNEQKEQCWRYNNIQFETIPQNQNNKYSMKLAQKQSYRQVEQS